MLVNEINVNLVPQLSFVALYFKILKIMSVKNGLQKIHLLVKFIEHSYDY